MNSEIKPLEARRASHLRVAIILALMVAAGGAFASAIGVFDMIPASGQGSFVNLWGDPVGLDGRGLYRRESISGAAQARAGDLVTLIVAVPLLLVSAAVARRGSKRGRLALAGILGYFLYTYASMAFGAVFNELFLLYVGLFALSLAAFVEALAAIDVAELAAAVAPRFPRRSTIALLAFAAFFVGAAWLGGRVLPAYGPFGKPVGIEGYHTLFIQVLDLGIVLPAAVLAIVWLVRRDPRGYLLGSILAVKSSALGLAVSAMGFSMVASGVSVAGPELVMFPLIFLASVAVAILALRSASPGRPE